MPGPPALLDEDIRPAVGDALVARGFDVLSVLEVGPRGVADTLVLERAIELRRVLITHNADHFRREHADGLRRGRAHPGILCVPQRGSVERRAIRIAMLLDWVEDQERDRRVFVWGDLQQRLQRDPRFPGYSEDEVRNALGRE